MEASAKPLVKGRYNPDLHVTVGNLRQFDATQNSTQEGGEPCCDFHNKSPSISRGQHCWIPMGPYSSTLRETLYLRCHQCSATYSAMSRHLRMLRALWTEPSSGDVWLLLVYKWVYHWFTQGFKLLFVYIWVHCLFPHSLLVVYSWVCVLWRCCRTILRDRKLVTEEYPMISPRLLSLVDYMLHKAPYWSIHKYEGRVNDSLHKSLWSMLGKCT